MESFANDTVGRSICMGPEEPGGVAQLLSLMHLRVSSALLFRTVCNIMTGPFLTHVFIVGFIGICCAQVQPIIVPPSNQWYEHNHVAHAEKS